MCAPSRGAAGVPVETGGFKTFFPSGRECRGSPAASKPPFVVGSNCAIFGTPCGRGHPSYRSVAPPLPHKTRFAGLLWGAPIGCAEKRKRLLMVSREKTPAAAFRTSSGTLAAPDTGGLARWKPAGVTHSIAYEHEKAGGISGCPQLLFSLPHTGSWGWIGTFLLRAHYKTRMPPFRKRGAGTAFWPWLGGCLLPSPREGVSKEGGPACPPSLCRRGGVQGNPIERVPLAPLFHRARRILSPGERMGGASCREPATSVPTEKGKSPARHPAKSPHSREGGEKIPRSIDIFHHRAILRVR